MHVIHSLPVHLGNKKEQVCIEDKLPSLHTNLNLCEIIQNLFCRDDNPPVLFIFLYLGFLDVAYLKDVRSPEISLSNVFKPL